MAGECVAVASPYDVGNRHVSDAFTGNRSRRHGESKADED